MEEACIRRSGTGEIRIGPEPLAVSAEREQPKMAFARTARFDADSTAGF